VAAEESTDANVTEWLQALGVTHLSEWDVLSFFHRHPVSLVPPTEIARLTGHDKSETGAVLHKLETLGLIQRSRASQGLRLYEVAKFPESSRSSSLRELMNLAQSRAGRLLLVKHLKGARNEVRRRHDTGLRLA
jgi:DNA-binding IclR family transcriptional regulator